MANTVAVKDLSPDQLSAYNSIVGWTRDTKRQPVLSLGGYAGSGKSTLVSLVAAQTRLPAFCAYTGKATSVLRRKLQTAGTATTGTQPRRDGMPSSDQRPFCGTIHSLIYRPCECREPAVLELSKPCPSKECTGETTWVNAIDGIGVVGAGPTPAHSRCSKGHVGLIKSAAAFEALKPKKVFVYAEKVDGRCRLCGGKEWMRRDVLDRDYGLIIVDEASMVDDTMLRDLQSYNVPILAVGDHGQLPPVGGSGSLMRSPHLRLEKIHRQAEGNPIIALSKIIRETGKIPESFDGGDAVQFRRLKQLDSIIEERYGAASAERLLEMGLACYTNRRRVGLNVTVRRARGTARTGRELPQQGEHVVCLRNMKGLPGSMPIANGMRGVLMSGTEFRPVRNAEGKKIGESSVQITGSIAFPDDGIEARPYDMLAHQFGREKTFATPEELLKETGLHTFQAAGSLFDYGYAMTVHKMQGSQYDDLAVAVERPGPVGEEDWRRWLYTATTRAATKLVVVK